MELNVLIENIRKLCLSKGLKPTVVFVKCGVGKDFIANLKKGQKPSIEKVQKLADYLGVTTSELLGEKKPPVSEDAERLNEVLANVDEQTREAMELLDQLNPENLARAKEYIRFELARQASVEDKK